MSYSVAGGRPCIRFGNRVIHANRGLESTYSIYSFFHYREVLRIAVSYSAYHLVYILRAV